MVIIIREGWHKVDHNNNLGYLIIKTAKLVKWDFNNTLANEGITSAQWGLIRDIYANEKLCSNENDKLQRLTPAAIAERLHADRPTVSCMIERLVKQGWAYRISNPNDRRSQIILLTEKTKELMPKLECMSEKIVERAMQGFAASEKEQFKQYLVRIIENLNS